MDKWRVPITDRSEHIFGAKKLQCIERDLCRTSLYMVRCRWLYRDFVIHSFPPNFTTKTAGVTSLQEVSNDGGNHQLVVQSKTLNELTHYATKRACNIYMNLRWFCFFSDPISRCLCTGLRLTIGLLEQNRKFGFSAIKCFWIDDTILRCNTVGADLGREPVEFLILPEPSSLGTRRIL